METALHKSRILLPADNIDPQKWAVIACDQFTAQPEYWEAVEKFVGDAPSTLRLTLPEARLSERKEYIPSIHAAMNDYLKKGVLSKEVNGFVLVERTTKAGIRPGLVAALDLEHYDYSPASESLIRATERTVPERVPPRAEIRMSAALEVPHVMMLIDDPSRTVIESLYERRSHMRPVYDFDLMMEGGHLRGWAVEGADADLVTRAFRVLANSADNLLYAVGDGNHSLAAAKQCWNAIREGLSEEERADHPARYALVELVNLECPSLVFEPIHRILFNVNSVDVFSAFREYLRRERVSDVPGNDLLIFDSIANMSFGFDRYPLPFLQSFLDEYVRQHPGAEIDYIHGEEALRELVRRHPNSLGFMPRAFNKSELFGTIRHWGVLPRKAFSMGEATEKRYYMEARIITR